jgi:hypothetical protein
MTVSGLISSTHCNEFGDKDETGMDQMKSKWKMLSTPTFVPALEGLRGIAVLMTCLSHIAHAKDRFININGKGGVSIFFVLSGFLITGVLAKQREVSRATSLRSPSLNTFSIVSLLYLAARQLTMR